MSANTGVMSFSSAKPVAVMTHNAPIATATIAVTIGRIAAINEPKVTTNTRNAMDNPIHSLDSSIAIGSPNPSPEASTVNPAARPISMAW